jgi:hypothetical protein
MIDHTFVILAHKESPYLEACVESILLQAQKSEVIITTSTPSDFSKEIANQNQIKYIVNDSGKTGVVNDFNFAYSQARTQYVTLAHQDDVFEKDYSKKITESMQKVANPLIAFTNSSDLINGKLQKNSFKAFIKQLLLFPFLFSRSIESIFVKKMMLAFGNPINCPTVTFNKQIIPDFEFSPTYVILYDWDAWLKLAKIPGAFVYLPDRLLQYRFHEGSVTSSQIEKFKKEELSVLKTIWGSTIGSIVFKIYQLNHFDRS